MPLPYLPARRTIGPCVEPIPAPRVQPDGRWFGRHPATESDHRQYRTRDTNALPVRGCGRCCDDAVVMIEKLLLKMRVRDDVSAEEEAVLRGLVSEIKDIPSDVTVVRADTELSVSNILLEGLMCRYKDLGNGERQVTELHVAGDFVDLHSFSLKRLDHNIMTFVPSRIALVPHERLLALTQSYPHLTRLLWFMTTLDAAIHREWALSLGRRTAKAKIAHVLCELHARLEIVGLTDGDSYCLPLTQIDLAECLGLTAIHVNRTLRELRTAGLVTFRNKLVTIEDRAALARIAEFDPGYLYIEKRPR